MLGGRLTTEELAAGSSGHQSGGEGGWVGGRPTISKTQLLFFQNPAHLRIPQTWSFIGGWVGDPQSPKPTIAQFF